MTAVVALARLRTSLPSSDHECESAHPKWPVGLCAVSAPCLIALARSLRTQARDG
ncbi:hypothetical protein OH77DRAFT_1418332 [Trametes cingulata]|nr:hypothetical protein OH77DRAFT_1418332 [Trametes cingulata]